MVPDSTNSVAVYEQIPQATILASRLRLVDSNPTIIQPGSYRKTTDGLYEITQTLPDPAPALLYLQVKGAWVVPAPDEPLESGQFKAVQVKGTVQGQKPPFSAPATDLVEGQILESGMRISTGEKSSVAILLPAKQSIRLGSASSVVIEQMAAGQDVTTNVNLELGSVFSRVGKRKKGTTDFRVKTPKAVAAARGTEFVTFWRNDTAITCTAEGSVEVLKPDGGLLGTMKNVKLGNIGFRAEPPINEGDYASVVDDMFTQIDSINPTDSGKRSRNPIVYYLVVKPPGSETPAAFVNALKAMPVYADDAAKKVSATRPTEDRAALADAIHQPTWQEKLMTPPMLIAAGGFVLALILLIGLVFVFLKKK
jgi:hypothetical protein